MTAFFLDRFVLRDGCVSEADLGGESVDQKSAHPLWNIVVCSLNMLEGRILGL